MKHGLMSAYTAFVAVDGSEQVAEAARDNVQVPVPVPHGVRYDKTVE